MTLENVAGLAPELAGAKEGQGSTPLASASERFTSYDVAAFEVPGGREARSKTEVSSENGQRARTQLDTAIFAAFGLIPIDDGDSGFVDTDEPLREINVRENERNLLGWSEAGEKTKFIVVALGFTPIAMDCSDECFGIVHGEGIYLRSIRLPKARTLKVQGWVLMHGPVPVSKLKGAFQDADCVVVGLFTPAMAVCDGYQTRESDL